MNVYKLLKANRLIKSSRLKLAGILFLHTLRKRYFCVFFDPVLACNLQCQMCYFSDEEKRKQMHGKFSKEELSLVAKEFFPYALKLQIGCGAEPTLYSGISDILDLAKKYGVPYVSMTTNANLLQKDDLRQYILKGLNEITISLHGVYKQTYEFLMQKASYETFVSVLKDITELKKEFKDFKLRINYTINADNVLELADFFEVFEDCDFDILQLRPIQQIGNSKYDNFSHKKIIENYENTIGKLKTQCKQRGITIICPDKSDLTKQINNESIVFDYTYIYASPKEVFASDYDIHKDTYHSYCNKKKFASNILKRIFSKKLSSDLKTKLNYDIK